MKRAALIAAGVAVLLGLTYAGLRVFVYDVTRFTGQNRDMWPSFGPGALVVLDRRAAPRRGDVVALRRIKDNRLMLRRVAGLPGDTLAFVDLRPFVDGVPSSWQDDGTTIIDGKRFVVHREHLGEASYRVLDDTRVISGPRFAEKLTGYFVLADNRDDALNGDSRDFGALPAERLVGVVRWVIDPGQRPYVEPQGEPKRSGAL